MTGKGEYYVRCKNCGRLIKVFKAPSQGYCTKCETLFDYDTQDIVFSGITTVPSDYHYEWKEEKNIEDELTKYKRAFEILKEIFDIRFEKDEDGDCWIKIFPTTYDDRHILGEPTNEQYELLEELMKSE